MLQRPRRIRYRHIYILLATIIASRNTYNFKSTIPSKGILTEFTFQKECIPFSFFLLFYSLILYYQRNTVEYDYFDPLLSVKRIGVTLLSTIFNDAHSLTAAILVSSKEAIFTFFLSSNSNNKKEKKIKRNEKKKENKK